MAWRIRRFFRTGKRSAKFNPALRSRGMPRRRRVEQADAARARSRASPVYPRRARARSGAAAADRRDRGRARARPAPRQARAHPAGPRLAPCPASGWITCAASPASATRGATRRAAVSRCSGKPRGGVTSASSPSACRAAAATSRASASASSASRRAACAVRGRPHHRHVVAGQRQQREHRAAPCCARPGTIAKRRCDAAARRRNSPPPRSGRRRCSALAIPACARTSERAPSAPTTSCAARLAAVLQHERAPPLADLQIARSTSPESSDKPLLALERRATARPAAAGPRRSRRARCTPLR